MEYITAYFWQPKNNACSLLLQQAIYRTGQPVLFACICGESKQQKNNPAAGVYLTECLREKFYQEVISRRGKPEKRIYLLGRRLLKTIARAETELKQKNISLCGILCIDNYFYVFSQNSEIWMHNTRFGRAHTERIIEGAETVNLQYGVLEKGVGILLGSNGLWKGTDAKRVQECLMVEEIRENAGAERHLKELCVEAQTKSVTDTAAVLLVSK